MLNRDAEPEVVYGDAFMLHLAQIWNLRISYHSEELYLFDDDVKGDFRHSKYHPDVAGIFAFYFKLFHDTNGSKLLMSR